jgi:hypothetical protein
MDQNKNKKQQLNIEIPEGVIEGTYSNLAAIAHSPSEFVVDFMKILPGMPKPKVQSRIVLTPKHAKRLYRALQDNLARYEKTFGPIKEDDAPGGPMAPFNMGGPAGQA